MRTTHWLPPNNSWRDFPLADGYRPDVARDIVAAASVCQSAADCSPRPLSVNAADIAQQIAFTARSAQCPAETVEFVVGAAVRALSAATEDRLDQLDTTLARLAGTDTTVPVRTERGLAQLLRDGLGAHRVPDGDDPVSGAIAAFPRSPLAQAAVQFQQLLRFEDDLRQGTIRDLLHDRYESISPACTVAEATQRVREQQLDGVALRDGLVRLEAHKHLRLVYLILNRMSERSAGQWRTDDLVGFGYIGLVRALERYNPHRPTQEKFSTYATHRIRGEVLEGIRTYARVTRKPADARRKVDTAVEHLTHELARTPTPDEISERVGMDLKRLQQLQRLDAPRSIDEIHDDDPGSVLGWLQHVNDPEEAAIADALREEVERALELLDPDNALAVRLTVLEEHTLASAAQVAGCSITRIRTRKAAGFEQLRTLLHDWSPADHHDDA